MNERMVWYKQKPGQAPQNVGSLIANMKLISLEFEKSGIKLERTSNSISLIIPNTTKHDEGTYFCGFSQISTVQFSTGTFLTVTDHPQPNITLLQTPALQSVPPGEAVNLQCTVLSEIRSAELRVFWIRSAAGSSFPEIIFTHHKCSSSSSSSSRQCEISSSKHSSVYNFSTNIPNNHHAATYYCAVETCGRIIIGNGTPVDLTRPVDSIVMILGAALGVCLVVISVQTIAHCKRPKCDSCRLRLLQGLVAENTTHQKDLEVNFAVKKLRMKSGGGVYSEVYYFRDTDPVLTY
uniref:Ig-like domain-containing protein n=1 Tax=Astyanax mexicanus TaxID=7994 RepID=A0A3B1K6G8_ASTMX